MEGGVTTQELETALKDRLSAVHTQINDISGTPSDPLLSDLIGGCGQSYEVIIVKQI